MLHDVDALSAAAIAAARPGRMAMQAIECHESCDSTNSLALARLRAGATTPFMITTNRQSAGRGRLGRGWLTPPGAAIAMTIGWHYPGAASGLAGVSLAVGVAVVTALERLGLHGVTLKWPNDLIFGQAKLGGILTETVAPATTVKSGTGMLVAIGIGINVREPNKIAIDLNRSVAALTDLLDSGSLPSRNQVIAVVVESVLEHLDTFATAGFSVFASRWRSLHAWQGRAVTVRAGTAPLIRGIAHGVAVDGALEVLTAAGVCRVHAGDVALEKH